MSSSASKISRVLAILRACSMKEESTFTFPARKFRWAYEDLLKSIKSKGKLTKVEMIDEFSKIIRLEPEEKDLEAIKAYDLKYANELQQEFDTLMNQGQ